MLLEKFVWFIDIYVGMFIAEVKEVFIIQNIIPSTIPPTQICITKANNIAIIDLSGFTFDLQLYQFNAKLLKLCYLHKFAYQVLSSVTENIEIFNRSNKNIEHNPKAKIVKPISTPSTFPDRFVTLQNTAGGHCHCFEHPTAAGIKPLVIADTC